MVPTSNINPFVVGGAIGSADGRGFYGREDIFAFVSNALNSQQRAPILLIGQRRIGKSSVLKQLQLKLGPLYKCIFYDLQGRAELTLDETLYGLGRAIADGLSIPRPLPEQATTETFPKFLASACLELGGHPERLVLLFDEFDVVDQTFAGRDISAKRFIPYLADIVAQFPALGYVLVVGRRSEELSDGFFSALLRQTVQMRIGRLSREQTQQLVTDSFGTRLSQEAVDEVFRLTAGHPFCAQILCSTIWNSYSADSDLGVRQVDEAVRTAVVQWTNGLNWNYDGFEDSTQRLFLSALASLSGPNAMATVPFRVIQDALFERRVGVDRAKLQLTPHDLVNWDVIAGDSEGYRFTVPLIGAWVQMARPLQDFEQETRLINPRAAKYYDLAVDSQQQGNLDDAILNLRNALKENPVFVEAQLALATSLRARNGVGDFDAAIEAYERVLELDPTSSPTTLLDMLIESIEANPASAERAKRFYKRIVALDTTGLYKDRATRLLQKMAEVRFAYGENKWLLQAVELWGATGDEDQNKRVFPVLRHIQRTQNVCIWAWAVSAMLWFSTMVAFLKWPALKSEFLWLSVVLAAVSGQAMSCAIATQGDGRYTFLRTGWIGSVLGVGLGLFGSRYVHNDFWLGVIVFFVAAAINGVLNDTKPIPPELLTNEDSVDVDSWRFGLSSLLFRVGARVAGGSKPKPSRRDVSTKA